MAFDAFLNQKQEQFRGRQWRRLTALVSGVLHAVALAVAVVYSFWHVDEISPKGVSVTLMSSLAVPPPPPPPPPAAAKKPTATRKPRPTEIVRPKAEIVQPKEKAAEEPPAEKEEEGEAEGEAGGSEGGVAGGVVGGVASGAPAPEPKKPAEPVAVLLPPKVGASQRISDLEDPRYRPVLPAILNRPGMVVRGLFRICVSVQGQVTDVKIVRSADPMVDNDWTTVIRRWQYRPFTLDGRPTPFCHPLMLEVRSTAS
jgi:protein TonB